MSAPLNLFFPLTRSPLESLFFKLGMLALHAGISMCFNVTVLVIVPAAETVRG